MLRPTTPRIGWSGLIALTMLACATDARPSDVTPAPSSDAPPSAPTPAVEPEPLTVVDIDAIEPEPEPEPEPNEPAEPLPFDEDQLERIAAVQDIVAAASAAHGVDPSLINALIWVESKFERKAKGPAGAQGLMQLMPKTAQAMAKQLGRKRNSYDPDFNIHAGTLLLSRLLARFDGDVGLALAGYNRGGGTVSKWIAAEQEFPEGVQTFVARVLEAQAWFQQLPLELEADAGQDR